MLIDPWSVSPEAIDQLAAQFFASSLIPYISFLYYMSRKETNCPPLANFGFRFLLVFVFATIPAGLYAKTAYHDILANIDWLHGSAESLLTITNLLIVIGFRQAISQLQQPSSDADDEIATPSKQKQQINAPLMTVAVSLLAFVNTLAMLHVEPGNALSLPTWMVHSSSLLEWLAAMGLIWKYADITGRQQWKGLVWGMIPLHTSGICACTYHLFYNAPELNALVAVQAALTSFGNAGMAYATWRIYKAAKKDDDEKVVVVEGDADSDGKYYTQLVVGTILLSVGVKWGSLLVDWPFEHSWLVAGSIIAIPTAINIAKWAFRSKNGKEFFGGLL